MMGEIRLIESEDREELMEPLTEIERAGQLIADGADQAQIVDALAAALCAVIKPRSDPAGAERMLDMFGVCLYARVKNAVENELTVH
jgi:hypothetical protein